MECTTAPTLPTAAISVTATPDKKIHLDDDGFLDWEERDESIPFARHALAGSVAGVAEHVGMFPLDTIKTRMQVNGHSGIYKTFQAILHEPRKTFPGTERGVVGLYRGASAIAFGCIPAHVGLFSAYEFTKEKLVTPGEHCPTAIAVAGMVGSVVHDVVITPTDVVKQRLQLGAYRGPIDCLRSIYLTEGVAALYRSLPITLLLNVPYTAALVSVNEGLKTHSKLTADSNILCFFLCAGIAGGAAAAVTLPLDVLRTQVQTAGLHHPKSSDVKATFKRIWQVEGVRGFTRGLSPRVIQAAPAAAICWGTYESVNQALQNLESWEEELIEGGVDPLEWEAWDPYSVPFW